MTRRHAIVVVLAVLGASFGAVAPYAATCTGANPCNACKNCSSCKRCAKEGGNCGACQRARA